MAVFKYEGMSASGQRVSGVVEAFDEFEALEKAKASCRVVSKVAQVKERPNFLTMELGSGKIKPKVIAIMCSQFSIIVGTGMGMAKSVSLVAEQTSDKGLKAILQEVAEDVAAGHSLANSFESKGGAKLPVLFYETIRAGEQAGTLDRSFDTLHKYLRQDTARRRRRWRRPSRTLFSSSCMAIVVVAVVMVVVIPTFKDILSSYDHGDAVGNASYSSTRATSWRRTSCGSSWCWRRSVIGVKLWTKTEARPRDVGHVQAEAAGACGKVASAVRTRRSYANTMSTLLASGLHDDPCRGRDGEGARQLRHKPRTLAKMTTKLEEGKRLGECMEGVPFLPRPLIEMAVRGRGERASLEETLATMGAFYDDETDRASQKALSKLEPGILIFIAAFAGYIVIALYLAMFSIYSGM